METQKNIQCMAILNNVDKNIEIKDREITHREIKKKLIIIY
jgi:hypothetical protein